MKKRIASLTALLLSAAMLLSACSEQSAEDTASADAASAETTTSESVQTEQTEQSEQPAEQRLMEFVDIYSPLFEQFFERYPETGSYEKALTDGYASAQCILDFVGGRRNHIQPMIDFCEKVLN